jgi:Arc/MetJ-type ribon-helix-helix transcriptional regulator
MHQIQLTNQVYDRVKRRADKAGFGSVDEYIINLLEEDESVEAPNLDHLFTPERLAIIDKAVEQIKNGEFYTMEEVDEFLAQNRAEWIRKNTK